jgi:diacylglycerol kinase (ATP)
MSRSGHPNRYDRFNILTKASATLAEDLEPSLTASHYRAEPRTRPGAGRSASSPRAGWAPPIVPGRHRDALLTWRVWHSRCNFFGIVTRRVQIIVTPGSGEGRAMSTARGLARALERLGDTVSVRRYTRLDALAQWATTCEADFTHLVCVGGDATQSTVAPVAMRLGVPFLPVPNGFGNIFARTFGHPSRVSAVVGVLGNGEVRRVDVGRVNGGELFLSHRSYGPLQQIEASVEPERGALRSRLSRHLAYYGKAKRFLLDTRPPKIRVEIDGMLVEEAASLVTVANVETYRGFLSLTPTASPIDGLFDVFIVPRASRLLLSARLVMLMLKAPGRWRGLRLCRGRHVVVTVNGRRREELETVRRALPLLVPRRSLDALAERIREADAPDASPVAKAS